jgi:hypothetical protein
MVSFIKKLLHQKYKLEYILYTLQQFESNLYWFRKVDYHIILSFHEAINNVIS